MYVYMLRVNIRCLFEVGIDCKHQSFRFQHPPWPKGKAPPATTWLQNLERAKAELKAEQKQTGQSHSESNQKESAPLAMGTKKVD